MIFYSLVNLGFSPEKAQVDNTIWVNALFDYYHKLDSLPPYPNDYSSAERDEDQLSSVPSSDEQKIDSIKVFDPKLKLLEKKQDSYASLEASQSDLFAAVTGFFPPDSTFEGDSLKTDSLQTDSMKVDTIGVAADTIKVDSMAIDSTARLKYFHYERMDLPYVTLQPQRTSPFIAQPTSRSRTIKIDSTGKFVEIEEKVAGEETKILLRVPIQDYIDAKLALHERELWEQLGYQYELKSSKKELGELIKNVTDFEIPLPKVGVLSIFGEPKISLKIGGAVDIHGAWRNENTEGVTASRYGNTRNEPDFKQQVQITVAGTIGDKLHINADWNTERTFQYENQLKIKYEGYEDEIIQSIEAGNVSLQTSPLVGGSEALFGLKANFKLGPLSLTTLASQKKGETEEVSVNSGTTSQEFNLRAYDYSTNHYFLDTTYASETQHIFSDYYSKATPIVHPNLRVVNIEVWKSVYGIITDRTKQRKANAYIDLIPTTQGGNYPELSKDTTAIPGQLETGWFELLQQDVDYVLHPETGYITFKTSLQDNDVVAVAYQRQNGDVYGEFLNSINVNDTSSNLVLKLVKPKNLQSGGPYARAWKLQLKNIYPLGGRNIKEEGFEFNIEYEKEGQDPVTDLTGKDGTNVRLLTAFGLDLLDASKQPVPDNKFDFRPNLTIFPETGEVIFPTLKPFGADLPADIPDTLKYTDVYDTSKTKAQQNKVKDKWLLTGKYSGEASSVYQLGFNVVENSVRVLLNGRELTPGTDYIVDYNIGQLTIRNDAALVPGADLKITYEKNDLFQLASKTLLGARGLFDFSDKTQLGFSILNLNQQTLSDKVRIGEEPLSNTIYGVDAKTGVDLPFVTKALDNIISTREMSTVSVSGEYAYINPDPNTKKSTIASDNGQSIAYIDDFEGAKRTIPVGVSYTAWKDLSPPDSLPGLSGLTPKQLMDYKGKSIWYTVTPSDVNVKQIWPNKSVAKADQQVTVMDYVFLPDTPGTYNYNPQLGNRSQNWGGIMKVLSSTANNLVEENIEFVEFWAKIDEAPPGSKVYLDLGRISEDVIPNRILNTEDRPPYNDLIDQGEDVGLDGWTDAEERANTGSTKSDPSGDNFSFTKTGSLNWRDYFNINGTEGNAVLTDIGRFPDTEDLNKNGNLDLANSYFRYEIPLDTNRNINRFIAGGGDNDGWFLYRVPLKDFAREVGSPSLTDVEYIRFFISGADTTVHLRITEFNLTGSQWQKVLPEDTTMSISVINIEDNPGYTSPPGVFQERDRTRPDEQIYRNEQSLNLILKDLPDGQSRQAVKYLYRPLDVFNYRQMKLFIHGDENTGPGSVSDTSNGTYAAEVYFRFGGDTNNFYEYRQPVRPGWNEISINFSELTAIKQARNDSSINRLIEKPVPGKAGHLYGVKGNPTLTSVKFLLVGIYNPREVPPRIRRTGKPNDEISGEIWVNELRVVGADDSPGWAYSFSSSVKLADLMTVNFNISQTNPYFHRLSDRFGSRVESKNWGMSADLNILKLLPVNLPESNLRMNYSHTESVGKPLYLPGTDIKVDEAARQIESLRQDTTVIETKTPEQIISESQTISTSDSWSASNIKIKVPTSAWYIRDTFNALSFSFNYNKTFSRSPTVLSNKGWVWNASMNYALNLNPNYYFQPQDIPVIGSVVALFSDYKDVKVFYTPQNFAFNVTARRQRNTNITRSQTGSTSQEIVSRDFGTTRGFNFNWKLTEGGFLNLATAYNVNITSSLAYLETSANDMQRPENEIWKDIFSGVFFGKDYRYTQSFDLKSNPKLPSVWDINRYFQVTAGYNVGYNWNFDFRQDTVGRSAGFASRLQAGLTLRLKALTDPLFAEKSETPSGARQQQQRGNANKGRRSLENRGRDLEGDQNENADSTKNAEELPEGTDTTNQQPKKPALVRALGFLKSVAKSLFFDYESIAFNYSLDNSVSKSGILGEGTGFNNFWGIDYSYNKGPSRAFMLGLSSDVGRRAPNGNLQDVFTQKNNLDFRTSRPLWEGAKLDINWKVAWSINKNTSIRTDQFGNVSIDNITETASIERSFLSLPPSLFLSVFGNGIKKVNELFDPNSPNPQQNLSNAFLKGFETLPLLSKLGFLKDVAKYIPRPNWHISWDGLENFLFFKSFAKKVSLEHAYSSTYTEGTKLNPEGVQEILTQRIEYGFSPIAGLNITFNDMWGGNLIGSVKYGTRTIYDLGLTTKNISETFSKDIGITAGFSKSGFELPLFGISLKNDIEFSLSYTSSKNSVVRYDMLSFTEEGTPQDGTLRTTMEPRIKYTISSKVTLSIFYRRTSVEPEGAARIPPTTTNEAGLDVHISIQ